jgi:hypothetical protein
MLTETVLVETVKRKHITQNRDIIKTNALAQLRIKELEDKVLALEAERTDSTRDIINIRRRMENAEKAALCMRQGWQMIGAGVAALSSIEGFGKLTSEEVQSQQHHAAYASNALQKAFEQAGQRASARITLDPNALPGGVVRNVAAPPRGELSNVVEEDSAELAMLTDAGASTLQMDSMEQYERTVGDSVHHDDENDSDHNDDGDAVSFSAGEEEETIRIPQLEVREKDCYQSGRSPMPHTQSHPNTADSFLLQPRDPTRQLHHASSIDSLSSFADDEEVELSTDDERGIPYATHSSKDPLPQSADLSAPRKRKTPTSSPHQSRKVRSSSVASTPSKDLSQSDNEDLSSNEDLRPFRRASMRDRKSINYALPKLNTKMRKPDPGDLVPAAKGEDRERRGNSSSEIENGETAASSDTISADKGLGLEQESPRRRKLKGKHEVASTGNLREIRRQHEQQHQQTTSAEESTVDGQEQTEGKENVNEASSRNTSPRRLSARRSLRERNSFDGGCASEDENVLTNVAKDGLKQYVGLEDTGMSGDNQSPPDLDHSLSNVYAQSLGTPIPKPLVRANQNGGIKALSMANRLQKAGTASSGQRPTGRQVAKPLHQSQVRVHGNGRAVQEAGGPLNRTNGSSRPFVPRSRSVSAHSTNFSQEFGDGPSSHSGAPSGDPAKRHSLHAAMTSPNMTELGIR